MPEWNFAEMASIATGRLTRLRSRSISKRKKKKKKKKEEN
jgi:hypothetical protein